MSNKSKNGKLLPWREAMRINIRAFRRICKIHPKAVVSRIVCLIFEALTPYVGIYLSAALINELAGGRDITVIKNTVLTILISAALIALATALLHRWREIENAGIWYATENIFAEKSRSMDYCDVDDAKVQALNSTINQNRNGGGWGITRVGRNVEQLLSAVITLAGGVALTVTLFVSRVPQSAGAYTVLNNPLFILAIIAVMLAITYISPLLSIKAGSYYAKNSDTHNLSNRLFGHFGFLGYNTKYAADIRIYRQDLICEKYNSNKTDTFCSKGIFAAYAKGGMGAYSAASAAVARVFNGAVYLFVCAKALGGAFGIGSVTRYIAAITKVSESIQTIIGTLGDMRNNASFLKLTFEYLDIPGKMYKGSLTVEKRRDRDYEIEFRDVSFKYPGCDTYALQHVNVKFKVGQRLAVVGQNGSGKTTFIKLLCRLYDPTDGQILLNGINIQKYDYSEYMSVFSVVFQDFRLFAFTLAENVASSMQYDADRVRLCLKNAGFEDRLKQMPEGIDTYLYKDIDESGVVISGGEAQKIALARALYKDSPFIILDEPTAALDPIAEAEVYSNFNSIVGDKTAVYISHRLSSCRFCDAVAVFDKGEVVQSGTHEELVADESGKYHKLWNAQAQYYTQNE